MAVIDYQLVPGCIDIMHKMQRSVLSQAVISDHSRLIKNVTYNKSPALRDSY